MKITLKILFVIAFVYIFSSCQPTPVKPVVINKNDGQLEKAIEQTPAPVKKYEAPKSWKQNYTIYDGRMVIEMDAAISLPDVEKYTVVKLVPGKVTQEIADKAFKYLFGDKPVYEPATQETKAQLTEYLLEEKAKYEKLKKKAKPGETEVELVEGSSSQMVNLNDMEKQIKELEKQIQEAPEKIERKLLTDTTFKTTKNGYQYIAGEADFGKKYPASLNINCGGPKYPYHSLSFSNDGGTIDRYCGKEENPPETLIFTKEYAIKKAQDFLNVVGLKDMQPVHIEMQSKWNGNDPVDDKVIGYKIDFTRVVKGIQIAYDYQGGAKPPERASINLSELSKTEKEAMRKAYRPTLPEENLSVTVTPEEIRIIQWEGVSQAGEVVNENVELLPFDEVMKRFEQMMSVKNAYNDMKLEKNVEKVSMVSFIDSIVFGYARIPVKDQLDQYTLQPVWCFYGGYKNHIVTYKNGKTKVFDPANPALAKRYTHCMLTLNAIDGSILEYSR